MITSSFSFSSAFFSSRLTCNFSEEKNSIECSLKGMYGLLLASLSEKIRNAKELVLLRCNQGEIPPYVASRLNATHFVITGGHELTNIDFIYLAKQKPTSLVITGVHALSSLAPSSDCVGCTYDRLSELRELVLTGAHSLENIPLENLKKLREITITGGDRFNEIDKIRKMEDQFAYINIRYAETYGDFIKRSSFNWKFEAQQKE